MESIVGQRFGAWTVIGLSRVQKLCKPYWVVECDCGTLSRATKGDLTRGKTKRCKDCSINRLRVANPTKTDQVYNVWCSMKARCYRTTASDYPRWGGPGIKVCDRWRDSYQAFCEDMGPRPDGYSLERIDNDGDYCPENCRWAPPREQNRNRRNNVLIDVDGVTMCAKDACRHYGITTNAFWQRIKRGWTPQEAASTPRRKKPARLVCSD